MKIGAALALEWLADLGGVREVAQGLDAAGFDSVACPGHLLSSAAGRYPERPSANYSLPYRDPFVLFGYLAGVTRRIRLRTGVLILPLLPTALVARQAADLSIISGGRLDLGIGVSWQRAEYDALGARFEDRGARMEEQIEVLRLLWTRPLVSYRGRHHAIDELGLLELPPAPIPIWIGCRPQERPLRRVARLADGWLPLVDPTPHLDALRAHAGQAGREAGAIGVAARLFASPDGEALAAEVIRLRDAGVSEITLRPPPGVGPEQGVAEMVAVRRALGALID